MAEIEKLTGHGAPSVLLPGAKGQIYEDLDTGRLYECKGERGFIKVDGDDQGNQFNWVLKGVDISYNDLQDKPEQGGGVSSWNDLTDKPFYSRGPIRNVICEEQVLNFTSQGTFSTTEISLPTSLNVGDTIFANFDGTEYEFVAKSFQDSIVYVGNIAIIGVPVDTGESFLIADQGGGAYVIATTESGSEHTVSFGVITEDIVQIDSKFLPVATDKSYGVVMADQLITVYNFEYSVPTSLLIEAAELFRQGRALITWNGKKVYKTLVTSEYIAIGFDDILGVLYHYDRTRDISEFNVCLETSYQQLESNGLYLHRGEGDVSKYATIKYITDPNDSNKYYLGVGGLTIYDDGILGEDSLRIKSSTEGSTKKFKITVDDSGTISATEIK